MARYHSCFELVLVSIVRRQIWDNLESAHPKHLVGKRNNTKDTTKDITCDSQLNSYPLKIALYCPVFLTLLMLFSRGVLTRHILSNIEVGHEQVLHFFAREWQVHQTRISTSPISLERCEQIPRTGIKSVLSRVQTKFKYMVNILYILL